jgi:transposase-like protein
MKRSEANKLTITALLANPGLTQTQVADIVGCSRSTVNKIRRSLDEAIQQQGTAVAAYQSLLREHLPPDSRARRLAHLAEAADRDATSLQAIQYVDSCLRLTPQTQPTQQDNSVDQPMFVLPSATHVTVNVQSDNKPKTSALGWIDIESERVDSA